MKTLIPFLLCGLLLCSSACNQDKPKTTDNKIVIGKIDSLHSKILNEERKIWIYVPDNGIFAKQNFPVVYLLDGDGHFYSVMGLIQQLCELNGNMVLPQMILIGIPNTDRARDLTPSHDSTPLLDSLFKTSGGGEAFASFIEKELIPYVDSAYPTTQYRTLIGHSFGGLTAINILINHTKLFKSYISIDPTMWWDNKKLLNQSKSVLAERDFSGTTLYLAAANTMGPNMDTTKVKTDTTVATRQIRSILELNKYLKANSRNNLKYNWKYYKEDDHTSVPLIAEYDGLRFIFDFYKPSFNNEEIIKSASNIDSMIDKYTENLSKHFGYSTTPSESFINQLGYALMGVNTLMGVKQYDRAYDLFKRNIETYPTSPNVYDSMGELLMNKGDTINAIQNYEKSLKLNPNNENAKTQIKKMKEKYKGK